MAQVVLDPPPCLPNDVFSATVTVGNQGDIAGDAGTLAFWKASGTHVAQPGDTPDAVVEVGPLAPGEFATFVFGGLQAPPLKGTYHCRAFIDSEALVDEKSEGNNQKSRTFTLYDIRLVITPQPDGVRLEWSSHAGWIYRIERAAGLGQGFEVIHSGIPATPPRNVHLDPHLGPSGAFYRVLRDAP